MPKPRQDRPCRSNLRRRLGPPVAVLAGAVVLAALAAVFVPISPPGTPAVAHADSRVFPAGYWGPLLSCTGNYGQVTEVGSDGVQATSTCNDFCDVLYTAQNILDFLITVTLFVGAPVMVAYGGILLMVGNPLTGEKENKRSLAKKVIVAAFVGVGITLGAYVILGTFLWLFGNGGPGATIEVSWPEIRCEVPEAPATF